MMLKDKTTAELASRLVEIATGELCGDGYVVTDVIVGYANPGDAPYGAGDDAVIVLGNWNTKRYARGDDAPLTKDETMPARLARALERVGAQCEWSHEWTECSECYRAIRTQPTSYGWVPQYAWIGECDIVCRECLLADIGGNVDAGGYVDNPDNAITWCSDAELEGAGWTQWAPGDPREYQSGWHPGQDDDPAKVLEEIRRETSADVVFRIQDAGQFDVKFRAYTRDADTEAEAEAEADN